MFTFTRTRFAGTSLLALLLATTACGAATAPAADLPALDAPAPEVRIYPPTEIPSAAPSAVEGDWQAPPRRRIWE